MFHPSRYRSRRARKNPATSTGILSVSIAILRPSRQWRYFVQKNFCNACAMQRYRHGCLRFYTYLTDRTASSQLLDGLVAYYEECNLKINSEMDLADKVLMDVFGVLRSKKERSSMPRVGSRQDQGSTNEDRRNMLINFHDFMNVGIIERIPEGTIVWSLVVVGTYWS